MPTGGRDDGTTDRIIANIDIDKIQMNPYQPRAEFEPVALDELRASIQEKGIIQPITVRRIESGYQLISGERRVRAARDAGLAQVPAYIMRVETKEEMLELALIENLQREHLNPIEIAISYKRLIDECSITQEQVSQKVGKDRSTVTNFLRLLKLPDVIQSSVRKGELSTGHARALIAVEDPVMQMNIFTKVVSKGLSVRDVERLVRDYGRKKIRRARITSPGTDMTSSSISSVEEKMRQALGTKVQVKTMHDGKGEIVIEYYSADDLERLIDVMTSNTH
ncbi:MAG: DNA-binding protein [Bacteroidetes bacterium]|nr:DNA-binding protein [Bacteroidota bacterium]